MGWQAADAIVQRHCLHRVMRYLAIGRNLIHTGRPTLIT